MGVHLSDQSFRDDADRQADYSDFLKRFQSDPTSISTEEAAQRYQELVSHAPPELAAEANQQIMGLLPQSDREVLADNISGSQRNIGLLDNILGKDSPLNSPLGKLLLSAVVAYLANRMLGQPQSQVGTRAPSGGLGDLISTILGAAARGQAPSGGLGDILGALAGSGAPAQQAPAGGLPGGLGDILGALAGSGAPAQQAPAGGLPGGLGDILGALAGGGAPAQQAPAGGLPGGLGDILGGLMQGDAPADAPEPAPEPQPRARSHRKS